MVLKYSLCDLKLNLERYRKQLLDFLQHGNFEWRRWQQEMSVALQRPFPASIYVHTLLYPLRGGLRIHLLSNGSHSSRASHRCWPSPRD